RTCFEIIACSVAALSSLQMEQVLFCATSQVPQRHPPSFPTRRSSDLSSTLYVPALTVTSVPLALPGNEGSPTPLLVTVMLKSAAFLVPAWSLMSVLITVRCACWSSFVIVQVLVSAAAIVPLQSADKVA